MDHNTAGESLCSSQPAAADCSSNRNFIQSVIPLINQSLYWSLMNKDELGLLLSHNILSYMCEFTQNRKCDVLQFFFFFTCMHCLKFYLCISMTLPASGLETSCEESIKRHCVDLYCNHALFKTIFINKVLLQNTAVTFTNQSNHERDKSTTLKRTWIWRCLQKAVRCVAFSSCARIMARKFDESFPNSALIFFLKWTAALVCASSTFSRQELVYSG